MKIKLPPYVKTALDIMNNAGFEAYIVGGCVRDSFLEKQPNDWDITTSALPQETMKVFSAFRTVETGIKHGTVTVIVENKPLEITTMRVDGDYSDNRHPDEVKFTSAIKEDLSRRDFTVNAIAYSEKDGICDPFGGIEDIKNKTIRCVGCPDKRFNEDALRIIRALRFSSALGFEIEKETAESIIKNRHLLNNVAKERIRAELIKLLCGKDVKRILLNFAPVVFTVLPELEPMYKFAQNTPYHIFDVWEHTAVSVESIKPDPNLRMTMLLHDCGKPEAHTVDKNGISHFKMHPLISYEKSLAILKRLRFSNADSEEISKLVLLHDLRPTGEKKNTLRLALKYGADTLKRLYDVFRADAMAQNPVNLEETLARLAGSERYLDEAVANKACLSLKDLAVDGNDIKALGFKGEKIGIILNDLLEKIVDGNLHNGKDEIINYINSTYEV
ncbi:MAG: HD domain-containing protein [Clostridia bacterium]|nr:HD domain-containing protein [Clostridia bacterium]